MRDGDKRLSMISLLFLTNLIFPLFVIAVPLGAEEVCGHFRNCYSTGNKARDGGKIPLAIKAYSKACKMNVKPSLAALQYSTCLQIIKFSGETDGYKSARLYFESSCNEGSANGCLFLGKLAAEQGNLARAIELTEPLCQDGFTRKGVSGYDACDVLKNYKRMWENLHPGPSPPPRPVFWALISFGAVFVFVILGLVTFILTFRKDTAPKPLKPIIFSFFGFFAYVYYEAGVPRSAAIRLDLFLLGPALITNLIVFIIAFARCWGNKRNGPGKK